MGVSGQSIDSDSILYRLQTDRQISRYGKFMDIHGPESEYMIRNPTLEP